MSDDEVGTLGEEAAKLMTALAGWAREHAGDLGEGVASSATTAFHQLDEQATERIATGAPECQWCPLCRTIHLWREASPEVRAHLAAAATSLAQAVAGMLATDVAERAGQGVQPIHLDEDAEQPRPGGERS